MKKILVLFLVTMLAVAVIGCSGEQGDKPAQDDNSLQEVKETGELVVGLDDAFPPMGFRGENGDIVGFDIDLAKEVAKRMDVELKLQPIDWDTKVLELNNNNIDLIWNGLTITEERQKEILFTRPYMEDKQLIVTLADSDINEKSDLKDKLIGCQMESSSYDAMQKDEETFNSFKEVIQLPNNNDVFMDLTAGRIDAMVVDEVVGRYYMAKNPGEYKVLTDHFGLEEFGIGLRMEDKALKQEIEKILDEMIEDGTAEEISNEWFGMNVIKK